MFAGKSSFFVVVVLYNEKDIATHSLNTRISLQTHIWLLGYISEAVKNVLQKKKAIKVQIVLTKYEIDRI